MDGNGVLGSVGKKCFGSDELQVGEGSELRVDAGDMGVWVWMKMSYDIREVGLVLLAQNTLIWEI